MSAWETVQLGEILEFQRGYDITQDKQKPGCVPIVSSSGISSYHNEAKVHGPGVIIGRKGTLGQVHYIETDYWPHDTTLWIKTFKGNSPRYIYYFLKMLHFEKFDVGAANPTLNRNHIHKLHVRHPSLSAQRKIADILASYDELIENNTRRIALLEKMAEEIYREWFVRLRFPGHESVPVHQGVPEGWTVQRLEQVVEFAYGKSLTDDLRVIGKYPVVGSSGIVGTHSSFLVEGPGIVVGRKGNVGSVHWIPQNFYPIDTVYYVNSQVSLYYLFYLLQSMTFLNNDAAVPGLNRKQAYANMVLLPVVSLISAFEKIARNKFEWIDTLRAQNEKLRQCRDKLLPRLLSGKLDVENLDIRFPPGMDRAE